MGTSAEHRLTLWSMCEFNSEERFGASGGQHCKPTSPSLSAMPREVAGDSSRHVHRLGEKIRSEIPLVLFVVTSADTTLSGRRDHARRGEEGLQRRLASEPYRTLRDFCRLFRRADMSRFSMLSPTLQPFFVRARPNGGTFLVLWSTATPAVPADSSGGVAACRAGCHIDDLDSAVARRG